ncbi:MAG: hypothetical protein WC894_01460 [Patescibacteria group bacterium]
MANTNKKNKVDSLFQLVEKNSNILLVKIGKTTHQSLESLRKAIQKLRS